MDVEAKEPEGSWAQQSPSAQKRTKIDHLESNIIIKPLTTTNDSTKIEEPRYDNDHQGPFIVFIDTKTDGLGRKPINVIAVSNLLKKLKIVELKEVSKVGYGRVKVTCKRAEIANGICNNKNLIERGYVPRILQHCISKIGIIFDIPTEISMEELKPDIKSSIPILKLVRVERRDREDKEKRIPTRRVKIFFKGQNIPDEVTYAYAKIKVQTYITLSQCYRCFRFNHFAQHCKEKTERCRKCYQAHEKEEQCQKLTCVNCKFEHAPTAKDCTARVKAFIIKRTMTIDNISHKEAHKKVSDILGNRFELLDNYDQQFPALRKETTKPTHNTEHSSTSYIHKLLPYARVTKSNNKNRQREETNALKTMQEWREATKPGKTNMVTIETKKIKETQETFNELNLAITKHISSNVNERLNYNTIELLNNIRTAFNKINIILDNNLIFNSKNNNDEDTSNIQSLKKQGNKEPLEICLHNHEIYIALLSETWLTNNIDTSLNNYNYAYANRQDGYGGVGIYLKKYIKFSIFKIPSEIENIGITTLNLKKNINIISVYCPPNLSTPTFKTSIEKILTYSRQAENMTLIGGDLNAKAPAWNTTPSNARGIILENTMTDNEFFCLNDGSTTFSTNNSSSAIDVTFINQNINYTWNTINKLTNSNHNPIIITLKDKFIPHQTTTKILMNNVLKDMNNLKIGTTLEEFTDAIRKTIEKNTINNNNNKYVPKHWWTNESQRLFRLRNAARKKYNQHKTNENCNTLTSAENNLREHIKEQKNRSFKEAIDEISEPINIKDMWAKIKNLKKYKCEKQTNNSWNNQDKRKYLEFIARDTRQDSTPTNPTINNADHTLLEMNITNFQKFLHTRNKNSAKGPDQISYRMLLQLQDEEQIKLFNLIENVWKEGIIPESWRNIRIIPIPKKTGDLTNIFNYRPICLLPVLAKLLEGILKLHIDNKIKEHNILPSRSYGFRKHYSTAQCVNDLINTISLHKSEKQQVMAACIDVEKAYDSVDINTLDSILKKTQINERITRWITSFLKRRHLILGQEKVSTSNGLAQGSGLSPTLFNLYTTQTHAITNENCKLFQFADDFFIVCYGRKKEQTQTLLNDKIKEFTDICNKINLKVNCTKTKVIYFNQKSSEINIHLNNNRLEQVHQIKYLGRYITVNNSCTQHIKQIVEKTNQTCRFLNILGGCTFGIYPERALQLYKTFARTKLDYAASTFANISKAASQKLTKCCNANIRRSLGLIRSTPTHIIYHMAAEMPPKYRFEMATAKEIIKCIAYNLPAKRMILSNNLDKKSSYYSTRQKYNLIFHNIAPINNKPTHTQKLHLNDRFLNETGKNKKETNQDIIKQIYQEKKQQLEDNQFEIIFTDGSIRNNQTGVAFIHERSNTVKTYYCNKTVASMTAELIAIEKAIEFAIQQKFPKVAILSDSLSSISTLKNQENNNYIAQNIMEIIHASDIENLEIHHIPAHSNIKPNDKVDSAAKNAPLTGNLIRIPWTIKDAIKEIHKKIKEEWEQEYKQKILNKGKAYGQLFPGLLKKPWFYKKDHKMQPTELKQVNRILSNHTFCKDTLFKMKIYNNNKCETCNTIENTNHIIFHCNKYSNLRNKYPLIKNNSSIIELYRNTNITQYHTITNFLKDIQVNL